MTTAPVPLADQIRQVQSVIRYLEDWAVEKPDSAQAKRELAAMQAALATLQKHERAMASLTFACKTMRGFVGGAYVERECTHGIDTNGEDCPDCIDAYFMEALDHIRDLTGGALDGAANTGAIKCQMTPLSTTSKTKWPAQSLAKWSRTMLIRSR